MIDPYSANDAALRRNLIASGQIQFTCANESHHGQADAFVTVVNERWAYCEGTTSATDHRWVAVEPAVSVAELELARLVRGRYRQSVAVSGGQASGPSVSRLDTRNRVRKGIA